MDCFHLNVILSGFSRHVAGWLLAERESAELAEQLIADTVWRHDVRAGMLTLHADRGAATRSKPVADNPYSRASPAVVNRRGGRAICR